MGLRAIHKATTAIWVLVLAVGLVACQQPTVPTDQFYRLDVTDSPSRAAAGKLAGTLEVERLGADGLTAERPIVYSEAGNATTLEAYSYHFWVEPPPVMLRDQLIGYLRAAGVASTIVTTDMRVRSDFIAGGRIKRLERITGGRQAVAVELELWIRRTNDDRLMVLQTYRVEMESGKDSVAEAVTAINRAVATIFGRFVDDIAKST